MLIPDNDVQVQYQLPQIVMMAEADATNKTRAPADGLCFISATYEQIKEDTIFMRSIDPRGDAESHFAPLDKYEVFTPEFTDNITGKIISKLTILESPKHGTWDEQTHSYIPDQGFRGKDRLTVRVTGNTGRSIVLNYYIYVTPNSVNNGIYENNKYKKYCPNGRLFWKISQISDLSDTPVTLQSLLSFIDTGTFPSINFSDLPGSAVAQTTDSGSNAQITLDTDAAGYGWFIDYTPSKGSVSFMFLRKELHESMAWKK
jgi:hypothetical protein